MPDRFDYAVWRLQQRDDPETLRRELKRLRETTIGRQITQAEELLKDHPEEEEAPEA